MDWRERGGRREKEGGGGGGRRERGGGGGGGGVRSGGTGILTRSRPKLRARTRDDLICCRKS